jgi:hypothetical protein
MTVPVNALARSLLGLALRGVFVSPFVKLLVGWWLLGEVELVRTSVVIKLVFGTVTGTGADT